MAIKNGLGSKKSLIEHFEIQGLYGYRNIGMSSQFSATILIAQNGSGKTTLLSAMDAFLRRQFLRLEDLVFDKIVCKLSTSEEMLEITKSEVSEISKRARVNIAEAAKKLSINEVELFNFVEGEYLSPNFSFRNWHEYVFLHPVMRNLGYSSKEAQKFFDALRFSYHGVNDKIASTWRVLQETFSEIEILYLPTYRRIELPINDSDVLEPSGKKRSSIKIPDRTLLAGNIQFGLSDISERLHELNQAMMMESNASYRQISANIINELLDGTFNRQTVEQSLLPDKEELTLFFNRLREVRTTVFSDTPIPNIDRIYRTQADTESNKFLLYYVSKLNAAMEATKRTESLVEAFANSCNKYLSNNDPSLNDSANAFAEDGKELKINRKNLSVWVESKVLNREIKLDSLSSGEKQMISLFAKMFLYDKQKLVLIDEPELSLSIAWQREILQDVLRAPDCLQIIAITHSPFIFDNSLERYANSLKSFIDVDALERLKNAMQEAKDEDGNDNVF